MSLLPSLRTDKRYRQVQQHLLDLMKRGDLKPGQQLPPEVELAAQLGISRSTLREALLHLEREGLLVRRHGVGTFVAPSCGLRLEGGLERLESVLEMAARQGMQVEVANLVVEQKPAPADIAARLQVETGTRLVVVRRVLMVNGQPGAYLMDLFGPTLLPIEILEEQFRGSVLDVLRNQPALHLAYAVADIVPVNANAFLASQLGVRRREALLLLEETLFDATDKPIEFSRNYFVPSLFRFRVFRR